MNKQTSSAELIKRNYDPSKLSPRPQSPDEILARIAQLTAENARLLAQVGTPQKGLPVNLVADREKMLEFTKERFEQSNDPYGVPLMVLPPIKGRWAVRFHHATS